MFLRKTLASCFFSSSNIFCPHTLCQLIEFTQMLLNFTVEYFAHHFFLHFTGPESVCECNNFLKMHTNHWEKSCTVAADLLWGLLCVPPPTTMTALVLSRGLPVRADAQTPTSRCSEMVAPCSTFTCTLFNYCSLPATYAPHCSQSADPPTLRDLAFGAHQCPTAF